MRNRFFLTTFFVLFAVSIGTIAIHAHFLRADRLKLIDQQVRDTAAALVDSELNDLRKIDFEGADEVISDELGDNRIGKFFIIRNAKDEIIYKSASASLLSLGEIPQNPQWLKIEKKGKFIRVLNLKLPRVNDRTLQVGILLDKSLIEFNYFSFSTLMVFATILTIGLIVSWLVSFCLMRPITQLENFFSSAALHHGSDFPSLPKFFSNKADHKSSDEFKRLLFELNEMIEKVNRNYRSSRLWSYQMAHELKTPLTLMRLRAEKLENGLSLDESNSMVSEINRINEIVQSFLSWAELENSGKQRHLFAIRVSKMVEAEVERLTTLYPSRLLLQGSSNDTLIANPQHFEQAFHNLLANALEYSNAPVTVTLSENKVSIADLGPGISHDVVRRLGEPFNQGDQGIKTTRGHGLGLAWVKTITRLYNWNLSIQTSPSGSLITLSFNSSTTSASTDQAANSDTTTS